MFGKLVSALLRIADALLRIAVASEKAANKPLKNEDAEARQVIASLVTRLDALERLPRSVAEDTLATLAKVKADQAAHISEVRSLRSLVYGERSIKHRSKEPEPEQEDPFANAVGGARS